MDRELKLAGHYARRYAYLYLIGIAALTAVDVFIVWIPRITGSVIDGLRDGTMDMAAVRAALLGVLGLGFAVAAGRFGWRFCFFGASRNIERDVRNDLFRHLETLSASYFNAHKTGDLMAHFTSDLGAVRQLLGITVVTAFDATAELILVLSSMILYVSPKLTLVAILPLIVIIFGDIWFGKVMHKRFLEKQEAFSALSDRAQESVSGIRVIKAFVQERQELAAFGRAAAHCRDKNLRVVRLAAAVFPLLDLIIGISILLTLVYGGRLAIYGEITIGQFVTFNAYITMLVWPLIAVGEAVSSISQGLASLKRIGTILDEKSDIPDHGDPSVTALKGEITLDDLTFCYPGSGNRPALQDLSVHIPAGETLAILGRTGAGKTTLVSLLERLWEAPRSGMILFDGRPIGEIPLKVLRRDIAYVPQDNFLFSDTLERNIAFGVENASREQVEAAAKDACVHENILSFPDGYSTVVGERGVTLSGGQKQRTGIARALMKDAPILILDDSLSAVDTDTEEEILSRLRALRSGRTTLIIAHRISTLQHADHILVLEDGRAAEYGTHEELMALGGIYRDIHDRQQLERELRAEGGEEK